MKARKYHKVRKILGQFGCCSLLFRWRWFLYIDTMWVMGESSQWWLDHLYFLFPFQTVWWHNFKCEISEDRDIFYLSLLQKVPYKYILMIRIRNSIKSNLLLSTAGGKLLLINLLLFLLLAHCHMSVLCSPWCTYRLYYIKLNSSNIYWEPIVH